MKKVIVTGGAGFIGSHTVVELIHNGYMPVIIDDFSNTDDRTLIGLETILGQKPILYRKNCTDEKVVREIFEKEKPHVVIHFAAFKAVGESVDNPLKYYYNNLLSLITLLKVMKEYGVKQMVFSSSCTVYGQPDELPVKETSPEQDATSPYGYSKQVCERMLRDEHISGSKMSFAMLRYFNPIGAHSSGLIGELPYGVPNNLVPYITQTAAGLREKLTIFGNDYDTADGTCVRDFIHVTDIARAHVKALEWLAKNPDSCEPFNLGRGVGNTVLEVVKTFEAVTGQKLNYEIGPRRSGDVEKVWADVSRANKELGWKSDFSLEDSLADAWRWEKQLQSSLKKA